MEKDCSEASNSMSCLSFLFSARVFGMFRKQTGIGYKASPSLGRIVIYSLTIAICSIAGNRMPAREPPAAPSLVKLSLVRRIQKYPDSLFDILLKFHRANNTSVCITLQLVDCISSFFFFTTDMFCIELSLQIAHRDARKEGKSSLTDGFVGC